MQIQSGRTVPLRFLWRSLGVCVLVDFSPLDFVLISKVSALHQCLSLILAQRVLGISRASSAYFYIFFSGLECVGHFFVYVAHFVFLGGFWIRTQRAAVASRCATNLATHIPLSHPSAYFRCKPSGILCVYLLLSNEHTWDSEKGRPYTKTE